MTHPARAVRFHVDPLRLTDPAYLLGICALGIREGWLARSTHACIEVFRLAAHARRAGRNPGSLFAWLVREHAAGKAPTIMPGAADAGDELWRAARRAAVQRDSADARRLAGVVAELARELGGSEAEAADPVLRVARAAGPAALFAREALLSVAEAGVAEQIRDSVAVRTAVYLQHGCPARRAVRLALDYEREHGSTRALRPERAALAG